MIDKVHSELVAQGLAKETEPWIACSVDYRNKLEQALSDAFGENWDEFFENRDYYEDLDGTYGD